MHLKDGRYVFRRYQLDDDGKTINNFEQEIDWIMGSGSRVRSRGGGRPVFGGGPLRIRPPP